MKDLKVLEGSGFKTLLPGEEALAKLLIVKNKGTTGRRVGIFAANGNVAAGQRLNHADALHKVKTVATLPQGYASGVEVNLSGKRNYYPFATYTFVELLDRTEGGYDRFAPGVLRDVSGNLTFSASNPDLSKNRTTLLSGDGSVGADSEAYKRNGFCSFTFILAGVTYHVGLDIAKSLAHLNADLNIRLNRIHQQLRGYISISVDKTTLQFHLAPPDGMEITIPLTTFATRQDLSSGFVEDSSTPTSGTHHLNNQLASALLIDNVNGIRNTTNTVSTTGGIAVRKTLTQMLADAFPVDLNTFTEIVETPGYYKAQITVPSSAFATWILDDRLNFAILKLQRQYVDGKVFVPTSIKYRTSAGLDTGFDNQFADLLVMPSVDLDGETVGASIYVDELKSEIQNEWKGIHYEHNDFIDFPESGGLNEESAAYIALFPAPSLDNRTSIFFRESVASTYIEIVYELFEAGAIPVVKLNDLGLLDYHDIKTEGDVSRPLSFVTNPAHDWNLEFIPEGQVTPVLSVNSGVVEVNGDVLFPTSATVGELDILNGLDLANVLPPNGEEPLYHFLGEYGAATQLYQNLTPVNVVTTKSVVIEKSQFKVVFPDTALTGDIDPLATSLVDTPNPGNALVTGRFTNVAYPKNVLFHSTSLTWSFGLAGTPISPTVAPVIDPLTGEFSVSFAINDLIAGGVGTYALRVNILAVYPWLADPVLHTHAENITVNSNVNGIEDDVTFIGSSLYDSMNGGFVNSPYRIVDMDSGEILAEGTSAESLKADALERGLVDIDLIFGKLYEEENVISCEGAPSSVDLDIDGEWDLEIEGVVVGSGTMVELKPLALTQDVQIITECIATPTTLLRGYKTDLKAGDVVRLAYQMTRGDLEPVIGSLAYKIGNTLTEDDENLGINRFGFDPLSMVSYFLNEDTNYSFLANNLDAPYNSSEWTDSCINGETVMLGSFSGQRFTDIDSGGAVPATLPVNIDGVDHSITINHHFKLEADTTPADIESLMEKFAVQLRALGLVVTLEEYDMFYPPAGEPWLSSFIVTYEVGQFSNVVIGGSLNVGSGSNARINTSDFHEYCRTQKTGVNTPVEFELELSGRDKMNTPGLIIDPVNIKFDTCANLGVNLLPGEIDYFPTIGIVEAGAFVGPFEIHSCGLLQI